MSIEGRFIEVIGVPVDLGAGRRGVDMGPSAIRVADLEARLEQLGHQVEDCGDLDVMIPETQPVGNPIDLWADAIADRASGGKVGLLTAPGFMEDHQIVAYLANHLRSRGCETHLATPAQLSWKENEAHLDTSWHHGKLDAVVRFFQSEWLPHLPRHCDWQQFFRGGRTPIGNPGSAVIAESKRLPLLWDKLETQLPTWRALLPETCDPRDCAWRNDSSWLLKATMSNTGDEVLVGNLQRLLATEFHGVNALCMLLRFLDDFIVRAATKYESTRAGDDFVHGYPSRVRR